MELLELIRGLAPEMIDLLERRYNILRVISHCQPIGRRLLAEKLGLGERIVRGELDFFKENQLLKSEAAGVTLLGEWEDLLAGAGSLLRKLKGLTDLEISLAHRLGLERMFIVPGNLDKESSVLIDLGRQTGRYLREVIRPGMIISVTGGSTMAEAARNAPRLSGQEGVLVVPGRGGLGENLEIQANTIAAAMAQRLGASYRLLHVPDSLGEEARENLMAEPKIQEVLALNKKADVLLHGIGIPREMSSRRELNWDKLLADTDSPPVGEVFGNYYTINGSVVYVIPTIGPKLEDLAKIKHVVAIAGGESKGEAILAVLRGGFIDVLITDQGAAEVIRKLLAD